MKPHIRQEPWPSGAEVLLRHELGTRTWCALPATVLDDGQVQAVLRIHAGTEWLAAHRPAGARAHSWERRWELRRTMWRGHDGTYVIPWSEWYGVAVFTHPVTGDIAKWYVNCQDPLRRTVWGFDTMDRELDVVLPAPGSGVPRWKDTGLLVRLILSGNFSIGKAWRMLAHARRASGRLKSSEFRAEVNRWLLPAGPPPLLDRLLAGLPLPQDLHDFAKGPADDCL